MNTPLFRTIFALVFLNHHGVCLAEDKTSAVIDGERRAAELDPKETLSRLRDRTTAVARTAEEGLHSRNRLLYQAFVEERGDVRGDLARAPMLALGRDFLQMLEDSFESAQQLIEKSRSAGLPIRISFFKDPWNEISLESLGDRIDFAVHLIHGPNRYRPNDVSNSNSLLYRYRQAERQYVENGGGNDDVNFDKRKLELDYHADMLSLLDGIRRAMLTLNSNIQILNEMYFRIYQESDLKVALAIMRNPCVRVPGAFAQSL